MSVASSTTPGMDWNSCRTPSILTAVTAAIAFGDLMFSQSGNQAGAGPTLLVGARGKVCPDQLDCGQAQLVEHEADALGIDGGVGGGHAFAHAASPTNSTS